MKPTNEQKQWLAADLYRTLRYKETHDEVYDHILLAVENSTEQGIFEIMVSNIIKKNFGGGYGLLQLEKDCRHNTAITAESQYRDQLKKWFLSPLIIVTIALFWLLAKVCQINGASFWIVMFFNFLLLAPAFILWIRKHYLKHRYAETYGTIKDEVISRLAFKAVRIIWTIHIINQLYTWIKMWLFDYRVPAHQGSVIIQSYNHANLVASAICVLIIVHLLSVIQLIRSEFNLKVIA